VKFTNLYIGKTNLITTKYYVQNNNNRHHWKCKPTQSSNFLTKKKNQDRKGRALWPFEVPNGIDAIMENTSAYLCRHPNTPITTSSITKLTLFCWFCDVSNFMNLSQQSISSNLSIGDSYILYKINKIQHGAIKELETIDLQG
jgi:hypothetical protein